MNFLIEQALRAEQIVLNRVVELLQENETEAALSLLQRFVQNREGLFPKEAA